MDFHVPAPAGNGPGDAATLTARGAGPLIQIPAGTAHLFRRIQGLVLQPVPGALLPVPTLCPQSIVESVAGSAVSTDGIQAERDQVFLTAT